MTQPINLASYRRPPRRVYFSRMELSQLLSLYSRRVMSGEWRDYAIDHISDAAIFTIFRHSFDRPLFRVTKAFKAAGRPAEFTVFAGPRQLRGGPNLGDVLTVFEQPVTLVPVAGAAAGAKQP